MGDKYTKDELVEALNSIYSKIEGLEEISLGDVTRSIRNLRDDFGDIIQNIEDNGIKTEDEVDESK